MKIVMILIKPKIISFLCLLCSVSLLYSIDLKAEVNKVLKDSLIDLNKIDLKYSNQPEYLFLNALIESDGESAINKYKDFYNKYPL